MLKLPLVDIIFVAPFCNVPSVWEIRFQIFRILLKYPDHSKVFSPLKKGMG